MNRILASIPQRLRKQHRLPAPSAPKRKNGFDLDRRIRRRSDGGILSATLSLRLPFSINATTVCSGCNVRCPQRISFCHRSFSLLFLRQFGPEYDVWRTSMPPEFAPVLLPIPAAPPPPSSPER